MFAETFEILEGRKRKGKSAYNGTNGDHSTGSEALYKNSSSEECLIKSTVCPGNKKNEKSLLIFKGLKKDGLSSKAGTPKKLSELALLVYLNNSRMVGVQKLAEPFFYFIARQNIKNGYLKRLEEKYCSLIKN